MSRWLVDFFRYWDSGWYGIPCFGCRTRVCVFPPPTWCYTRHLIVDEDPWNLLDLIQVKFIFYSAFPRWACHILSLFYGSREPQTFVPLPKPIFVSKSAICITIHMPQKWNLSSSVKCTFFKTRANRILVKKWIVFITNCDAQCNQKLRIVIFERNWRERWKPVKNYGIHRE